jgi:hypothetical protein
VEDLDVDIARAEARHPMVSVNGDDPEPATRHRADQAWIAHH